MPLFTVRPSRGSWAFFGLVALSAAAARGYDHRERVIARRDGPVASIALDFARCIYGPDTVWLLDDTGITDRQTVWSLRSADWLRNAATSPQAPNWPGRCAPMAEHLAARLDATPASPDHASSLARTVASDLLSVTADPMAFLNTADGEGLSERLATLLAQVRGMSTGAAGRWHHDAPMAPSGLGSARLVHLARLLPLAPGSERPVLASSTVLLYRTVADGAVYVLDFDPSGRRDVLLASGAPLREPPVEPFVRVEGDNGPSLVLPSPTPRMVPFPPALARGAEAMDAWTTAITPDVLALLTSSTGTLSLRTTARDGPTVWSAPISVGPGESALAAVVSAGSLGSLGALRVTVLRPRIDDAVLEQYVIPPGSSLPDAEVRAMEPPATLLAGVPAFGARVTTCAAGAVRYFAVAAESVLSVVRVDGATARMTQWALARGHGVSVVCDDRRMLVGTDPSIARGGWQAFDFPAYGPPSTAAMEPPLAGPGGRVEAMALVGNDAVAVVSDRAALRTFTQGVHGGPWRSAGLVALLTPAAGPVRTLTRVTALGGGHQLALLLEGTTSPRPPPEHPHDDGTPVTDTPADTPVRQPLVTPFVSLLVSTDGGGSFTAP